jgi:spore germination protein GerM
MWFYFQKGSDLGTIAAPIRDFLPGSRISLPANQALFYYTRDGRNLIGAIAEVGTGTSSGGADRAKALLEQLLAGRGAVYLRSAVPPGTKVLSVFVRDRVAIVNLSREFSANCRPGPDAEMLAVYAIVNTVLHNVESVDSVQILVDGESLPTLRGHMDIESPLVANSAITRSG